ncbi:MAG TPA: Ldh family oxidoreductase [Candidatus Dormibacteraeota bacterium]|nr:Ldh family oxidoreductase [Candidatus Dormibacteraeota bacterium]
MPQFAAQSLRRLAADALRALDVPSAEAALVADSLVDSELEGQASHGFIRFPFVLDRLRRGLINPRPSMSLTSVRPAVAVLDADNCLGPVAGMRAVEAATERALAAGAGVVAVRRSNHLGSLSFYLRRFTASRVIGLAFTNTPPAMPPPGGHTPYLGTNPIAAGFPTSVEPVIVDLATSQVARGRILKAARVGEPIPEGWAVDAEGQPTTDPEAAIEGSLLPLGGHKGFALALLVEVLSGVLSAAAVGPEVGGTFEESDRESNVGHCFVAIDPAALVPGFAERMDRLTADIRRLGGRVPGDRRHSERAHRLREGIELSDELVEELRKQGVVA